MGDKPSHNVVGSFIREKREAAHLSQRSLGQLFDPPVTTQFISNIERGVTPLPPVHVATLVRALKIQEGELLQALEQEYSAKISNRLGRPESGIGGSPGMVSLSIAIENLDLFKKLSEALAKSDPDTRARIRQAIAQLLQN